jgi:hypothetical protein
MKPAAGGLGHQGIVDGERKGSNEALAGVLIAEHAIEFVATRSGICVADVTTKDLGSPFPAHSARSLSC